MSLRVVFCGTPDFALPALRAAAESSHPLVGVITTPDRPRGRGRRLHPSPVKVAAQELGLTVWQPEALNEPDFLRHVERAAPDILLVVAFRILPEALYGLPPRGAINVHASLLPEYRGAAPIARALMDGRTETGVTTFQIVRRVDQGGILLQHRVEINPNDDAGSLGDKLARCGARLAVETLDGLEAGRLTPRPQDHARSSRAPKLTAADRPIRWQEPARASHHRVRALAPRPGAVVQRKQTLLKVLETDFAPEAVDAAPGRVIDPEDPRGIAVATGEGTLFLRRLQPEGKGIMAAAAYVRGRPFSADECFD